MFNKLSTKALIILFVGLLIIVAAFLFYDSEHGERSFKNELVNIDTAKVTSINIYPKNTNHKLVKIFKEGNFWKVDIANNKTAYVPNRKVNEMFTELLKIKPLSVAGLNKSKWIEYQVDDSSGTEIKIFEGGNNTLDLTLGKFAFERPRTMSTYVRVAGDDNVYKVNGMPGFLFNQNANYFRDGRVVNDNYSDWTKISFSYPGDSSFTVEKKNKGWVIGLRKADSTNTINYFRSLSQMNSQKFKDNFDQSVLSKAAYTLTINSSAKGGITITSFISPSDTLVNSSTNPDAYFDGSKNNLLKNIFVGKEHFFKKKKRK
ncbi:MAG: DUF4340 domain-containing protein [Ignavibacteriaceae bacterium]|jgi:hypothetical protein